MTRRPDLNTSQRVVALIETKIGEQSLNSRDKIYELEQFSKSHFETLNFIQPEFVICPLFTLTFDVIDIGKAMADIRLDAELLIVSPPLPRPGMVLREINDACPRIRVSFFDPVRWNNVGLLTA